MDTTTFILSLIGTLLIYLGWQFVIRLTWRAYNDGHATGQREIVKRINEELARRGVEHQIRLVSDILE